MTAGKDVLSKGLALVVDDVQANREDLEALLKIEGYETISAENGQYAVALFTERNPDIIFMDDMMPVMDGCEATTRIKAFAGTSFVPIIFITSLSESDALVRYLEAGGDEFLSKPFKHEILVAKIRAMERIRDLSRTVARQHQEIQNQHRTLLNEQYIAEQIYNRAITSDNISSAHIQSWLKAVSVFSGDMLLTAFRPDNTLHVFLGDFTGHGLTAAVGVLPAAEVFRAMTAKGFLPPQILEAINAKLYRLLPTGMFLAGCFVSIDTDFKKVTLWNTGMPDILLIGSLQADGTTVTIKQRFKSNHMALGILESVEMETISTPVSLVQGDRILLCSDGVTEAMNMYGEEFGVMRYEKAASAAKDSFSAVKTALEEFTGGHPFNDDVSLVEIDCAAGLNQTGSGSIAY